MRNVGGQDRLFFLLFSSIARLLLSNNTGFAFLNIVECYRCLPVTNSSNAPLSFSIYGICVNIQSRILLLRIFPSFYWSSSLNIVFIASYQLEKGIESRFSLPQIHTAAPWNKFSGTVLCSHCPIYLVHCVSIGVKSVSLKHCAFFRAGEEGIGERYNRRESDIDNKTLFMTKDSILEDRFAANIGRPYNRTHTFRVCYSLATGLLQKT